ncbi:hypothetical protein GCM10008934_27050 [Virgibacillus salarius]
MPIYIKHFKITTWLNAVIALILYFLNFKQKILSFALLIHAKESIYNVNLKFNSLTIPIY